MFDKILIANRGEIACRVIRTARRMGVRTVAVYSDADRDALHVDMADEAFHIGPAPAADSYLKAETILEVAKRAGAQAIHPGYGFLSENADFADACAKAGVVFIGPPADAIRAMGSKSAAKAIMEKAGVPVVPGYHGDKQDAKTLKAEADKIGYPILIKASAGGGGKGMRLVESAKQFEDGLKGAKREAAASFGDDQVLIEKFVEKPRHIEIQVFADAAGNAVHLFERDCSVQRRHQKVLEEAPGPTVTGEQRAAMGKAATDAAKAIGYVGAGTVEFIAGAGGDFYFMEMNTRLQVEHPVTELVTGQDLVEWQLRVAAGGDLPAAQEDLSIRGHAVEARLYAEDPHNDFLPATGNLVHLRLPDGRPEGPVRVDTGVREGDTVSPFYDPMIAKLIAWGETRDAALSRLAAALEDTEVVGVATNAAFLRRAVRHPQFRAGDFDTGFIAVHEAELLPARAPASDTALAVAALGLELHRAEDALERAAASGDPYSPWNQVNGWRLNDEGRHEEYFVDGDREVAVTIHYLGDRYRLDLPGGPVEAWAEADWDGRVIATLGGHRIEGSVVANGHNVTVFVGGERTELSLVDPMADAADLDAGDGALTAPMSGKVIEVLAKAGETIERGAPILIVEAMKMEHTIAAPADGTVTEIFFEVGDQVDEGAELAAFEAAEGGE